MLGLVMRSHVFLQRTTSILSNCSVEFKEEWHDSEWVRKRQASRCEDQLVPCFSNQDERCWEPELNIVAVVMERIRHS